MAIATFRGEKNVGEIADKLFVRLTPKQRHLAEAALLKANPRLRKISSVLDGTILRVPDLPGLRSRTSRGLENSDAQIAKTLTDALESYSDSLGVRFKADRGATKTQISLLKSAKLKKALADTPALQALAETARKALDTRARMIGERQKALEKAIRQAQAELKTRTR